MKKIVLIASIILSVFVLSAQENGQYGETGIKEGKQYVITLHDDFEYIGEILNDDGREILLQTNVLGNIYIPKFEIRSVIELKDNKHILYNEYQPEGPFTTRYTFTTNALPIKKGENYGMLNLYGPEAHIAVSDNFNVGVMSSWIASPLVLAMKYSFKKEESNVNFSFGTLLGTSGYLNSFKGYGGLHWLNITTGDRKKNLTFSGGYAYIQTGMNDFEPAAGIYAEEEYYIALGHSSGLFKINHGPIISVAGIFKIGARASFVFDSMIGYFNHEKVSVERDFISDDVIYTVTRKNAYSTALFIMPGVRFQKTDRKAFQVSVAGLSMFGDTDLSFPIPMCSWFYKF